LDISIQSSCDCKVTISKESSITTDGSGAIKLKLNTGFKQRYISESVKVYSNDPDKPLTYLTIMGSIKDSPLARPTRVFLGNVSNKIEAQRTIKIIGPIRDNYKITTIKATSKHIKAKVISIKPHQEAEIAMILSPAIPIGNIDEKLTIYLSNKEKIKTIEIKIEGNITGEITIYPDRFFFGIVTKGITVSRKLELSKTGKENLNITSIESSLEFVSVRSTTIKKGNKYLLESVLSKDAPLGIVSGTIKVCTSNFDQPIINIPLYALVQK